MKCADCSRWKQRGVDCYGTRYGRCSLEDKGLTLEGTISHIETAEMDSCPFWQATAAA